MSGAPNDSVITEKSRVSLSVGAFWSLAALISGLVAGYFSQQSVAEASYRTYVRDELAHYTTREEIQHELRGIDQKLSDLRSLVLQRSRG